VKQFIKRHPVSAFFVMTILWIWISMPALFAMMQIRSREDIAVQHVILVFLLNSPSAFGILLTLIIDGRQGPKALLSRALRWRASPVWYAVALLVPAAMYGLNYVVYSLLAGSIVPINIVEKLVFSIPTALMACLLEEFGWRGFAQFRLQRRYSALASTMIVGVGWGLWHLPINYLGVGQYGMMAIPLLLIGILSNIALSVLLAWVHNNTEQSMLLVLLCHFAITFSTTFFGLPSSSTAAGELRNMLLNTAIQVLAAIAIIATTGLGTKWLARASRPADSAY
jgi:membrane protease YdiL (CAAX protease family)